MGNLGKISVCSYVKKPLSIERILQILAKQPVGFVSMTNPARTYALASVSRESKFLSKICFLRELCNSYMDFRDIASCASWQCLVYSVLVRYSVRLKTASGERCA